MISMLFVCLYLNFFMATHHCFFVLSLAAALSLSLKGIFMPALLIGACLGRTIGEYFEYGAQAYAIIGAGAILGGITRVLISISVILANGIGFNYMLVPLMLVFLMARTVGNMCGEVRAKMIPSLLDGIVPSQSMHYLKGTDTITVS